MWINITVEFSSVNCYLLRKYWGRISFGGNLDDESRSCQVNLRSRLYKALASSADVLFSNFLADARRVFRFVSIGLITACGVRNSGLRPEFRALRIFRVFGWPEFRPFENYWF